jgi:CheY-specific phosphatase CheX
MNVAYINSFINSTRDLFEKMVKLPVSFGRARLRAADEQTHRLFPISAVIALGGGATGLVLVAFAEPVAVAVAAKLADATFDGLTNDCRDALAEAASMIAGGAKATLPGGLTTISVPKVLASTSVLYPANIPFIAIPCDTPAGRFIIEVGVREAATRTA